MRKNDIVKTESGIFRILSLETEQVLAIDCEKKTMPQFFPLSFFENGEFLDRIPCFFPSWEELTQNERKIAQKRYTMIAALVAVVSDRQRRNLMIDLSSKQFKISKQTLRSYLCAYLIHQDLAVLAPKKKEKKELTQDQKVMRWALNKFFYTRNQNSLSIAYTMILKEKYCDAHGNLFSAYPTFNQFRYFYRKNRKIENYHISRDGLTAYQRNRRPLVGDGVQEFAPVIGTAMLDSTVCDIYLIDEKGELAGRPILTATCDANTSMCLGYVLSWENGTNSLKDLMLNIITDKVEFCKKKGIPITQEQWNIQNQLPGILVTDQGAEYTGQTFEQISELGITLINLPAYRPELKGSVEKLFDLIQNTYRDLLKGRGVIMADFQERGAHDYREDAILTLQEFERIVIRCIIHYNCSRVIENYPYTSELLEANIPPFANQIWNWKLSNQESNLIEVSKKEMGLTLLPRTKGKFTRRGLKANGLRYFAEGYKEQFLQGGDVIVSYDPENCNKVWIREKDGSFVEFNLIEKRFLNMSLEEIQDIQNQQKQLVQSTVHEQYQSKIDLMNFIETVAETSSEKKKQ